MKEKHNGIISFWKFAFAILIILLHIGVYNPELAKRFVAGSIAVDFFFIVSGYLFCKKALSYKDTKNLGQTTITFFLQKVKRFVPYILILWIASIPVSIIIENYTKMDFINGFLNLLYIPNHTHQVYEIHGITWYITVLIVLETVLLPLIIKFKDNYIYIASFIIIVLASNYLIVNYKTIATPWVMGPVLYEGYIRGLLDISIGLLSYKIVEKVKEIDFTNFSLFLLTLIEIIGYSSIFYLCGVDHAHQKLDIIMLIIIIVCVIISFSQKSLIYEFSNNRVFYYLEKLSLPMYINQFLIIIPIHKWFIPKVSWKISSPEEALLIIALSIVFAAITLKLVEWYNKLIIKAKPFFIKEKEI